MCVTLSKVAPTAGTVPDSSAAYTFSVMAWGQVAPGVVTQVAYPPVSQAQIDMTTVTGRPARERVVPVSRATRSPNSLVLVASKPRLATLPGRAVGIFE